jgi:hypothetical protein
MSELKNDILEALRKERDRLNDTISPTQEDEDRLSLCVEFIKHIKQSDEQRPALLSIERPWSGPIKL